MIVLWLRSGLRLGDSTRVHVSGAVLAANAVVGRDTAGGERSLGDRWWICLHVYND